MKNCLCFAWENYVVTFLRLLKLPKSNKKIEGSATILFNLCMMQIHFIFTYIF